jgi:hypothetical protein
LRRHPGVLAIVALTLAYASVIQASGWAQTSYFALVKSAAHGTPAIDRYQWETRDKSYFDGHFYSVKGPALSFLTLPLYEVLDALDAQSASTDAAREARAHGAVRWFKGGASNGLYGDDLVLAKQVRKTVENETLLVWLLGLLGCVAPAMVLLLLVRNRANVVEPGFGTAAAVTLGLGTLILPFATLFFSHVLAAFLSFAAFALAWREREAGPRLAYVATAGLLSGLAVTTEYPLAISAAIVGIYAVGRANAVRRAAAYGAGVAAGVLPLLLYNLWAFGSVSHFSYADAVKVQGRTGHDVLGLNNSGFFGIGVPKPKVALDLLFASKGLLTLSPVLVLAVVGVVLLYRRGRRAEALVIGGTSLAYLTYNSGYYLPFGGGSLGPRFLIPLLPFLAVPLSIAYRRFPAMTVALAIPSAIMMLAGTITQPLLGNDDTGYWAHLIHIPAFEHTIATVLGAGNGWLALLPLLVPIALAIGLTALATCGPLPRWRGMSAATAVLAWGCLAAVVPELLGHESAVGGNGGTLALILVCVGASLATLLGRAALERVPRISRPPELLPGRRGA